MLFNKSCIFPEVIDWLCHRILLSKVSLKLPLKDIKIGWLGKKESWFWFKPIYFTLIAKQVLRTCCSWWLLPGRHNPPVFMPIVCILKYMKFNLSIASIRTHSLRVHSRHYHWTTLSPHRSPSDFSIFWRPK